VAEHFNIGHDCARSEFDASLANESPEEPASFLFGGIGDARHLYATLIGIAKHETDSKSPSDRNFHFTINDINPVVFARDIVIFFLLLDLSQYSADCATSEPMEILTALYFIYAAPIMPAKAADRLQNVIEAVIGAINDPAKLPSWIYLYETDHKAIINVLESWKVEVLSKWNTAKVRAYVVEDNITSAMQLDSLSGMMGDASMAPEGCAREKKRFRETAMLEPPPRFVEMFDSDLWRILQEKPKVNKAKLEEHLDNNWKTNTTLVDVEWENCRDDGEHPDMRFDPFTMADHLTAETGIYPQRPERLFDYCAMFFLQTARALDKLKDRLTLEIVMSEVGQLLEKTRNMDLHNRNELPRSDTKGDRSSFPRLYDRIHLSNIP
jgi:hypothetical protein